MVYFNCGKIRAIQVVNARCFVVKFVFSVFIFSMPSKVIIIVIKFMFLGLNMFWALLRAHFCPLAPSTLIRFHTNPFWSCFYTISAHAQMNSTHAHFNILARKIGAKLKPHSSVCPPFWILTVGSQLGLYFLHWSWKCSFKQWIFYKLFPIIKRGSTGLSPVTLSFHLRSWNFSMQDTSR